MLKVTVSGAFRSNNELNDFSDVELTMPDCPDEWIKSNAINRCFPMEAEKIFKKRVDSIHSLYIDKVEKAKPQIVKKTLVDVIDVPVKVKEKDTTGKMVEVEKIEKQEVEKEVETEVYELPLCAGKKIKSLDWEELQHFAMMFCLRAIPLYRGCDLRTARQIAYREYVNKILGKELKEDYDFAAVADFDVPETAVSFVQYEGNADKVLSGKDKIIKETTPEDDGEI